MIQKQIVQIICIFLMLSASAIAADFYSLDNCCFRTPEVTGYKQNYYNPGTGVAAFDPAADWTVSLNAPVLSSLRIADVDGDQQQDIICTTYGPDGNPYGAGQIFVFNVNGDTLDGWPYITNKPFPASASIGDVDNDGDIEIVAGDWSKIYLLNHDGTYYPGWPLSNGLTYSPAIIDLDDDGDMEIIYTSNNLLYIRHHDGELWDGFPVSAPENIGSPSLGDMDLDGQYEIIAGTTAGPVGPEPYEIYVWKLDGTVLSGFPVSTSGVVKSTPAIADIDNDDFLEIVVAAYHTSNLDYLYCLDWQGNHEPGWPVRAEYIRLSSPALGDVDHDNDLEIFIGGYYSSDQSIEVLFAYHHDGQPLNNFPVELFHDGPAGNINSSPVIAEVDGDTMHSEVFVKVWDHIYALHSDGTVVDGFPYFIDDENHTGTHGPSPAIGDLDYDGDADYVFISAIGNLTYIDAHGDFNLPKSPWQMYKHDSWGTGLISTEPISSIETESDLPAMFWLNPNYPNPFNAATTITYQLPEASVIKLDIFNLLGQKIAGLVDGFKHAGVHTATWSASNYSSGIYFYKLSVGDRVITKRMTLLK